MIHRAMQPLVDRCLHPINQETGESELLPQLVEVRDLLLNSFNAKLAEMEAFLYKGNPKLRHIYAEPVVNFTRSLTTTNIHLDTGDGLQQSDTFGEGTKKKLWMSLLEWECQEDIAANRSVIRVYDEPNINLDYAAERKLFAAILATTRRADSKVQAIVSTHAVTLIDRAPAQSINHIRITDEGKRVFECLTPSEDEAVKDFLAEIGRSVGISNSAIFLERGFLVVEGESEEAAIPIIYKHLYNRSLIEDGICLINLRSCGAWQAALNVLSHSRADITIMLLDKDVTHPDAKGITPAALIKIGYPDTFHQTNCFFIGQKEFEDAFSTEDIVECLNSHYPKEDGNNWADHEIDLFRAPDTKFSKEIIQYVRRNCVTVKRPNVRKPDLAEKLAKTCCQNGRIPKIISDALYALQLRIGLLNPDDAAANVASGS